MHGPALSAPQIVTPKAFTVKFLSGFVSVMHSGGVAEYFEDWLHEEIVWATAPDSEVKFHAKGRREACAAYNKIVAEAFGGPNCSVSFELNNVKQESETEIIADFTIYLPRVVYRTWEIVLKDSKIYSIFCKPRVIPAVFEMELPPLPPPTTERPCSHNEWDSVRVKRKQILLRCRKCASQWKLRAGEITRCVKFTSGMCRKGPSCTLFHIYSRKQTKEERQAVLLAEALAKMRC
eukprot:TRINITY_DN24458_c0_g1_i1.p1 TRINITY_DN24458_c0_g1~~TRINITY_DN24458_c0_g1_i1.p1  ORF type:complete len:260 (+),score=39.34 TRINITY_DN24458_c0_g1_i1:76-780(+)